MSELTIRPVTPQDSAAILHFVRELAIYEKAEHEAQATPEHLARTLFAPNPRVFGLLALAGDEPVGFAIYFFNYSTWQGRHGLYLEGCAWWPFWAATAAMNPTRCWRKTSASSPASAAL